MTLPATLPAVIPQPHPAAETGTRRFDAVTITIHWTTLALILSMFASAWMYGQATDNDQANLLLATHRSLGVVLWCLTLGRVVWRARFGAHVPLPASTPKVQHLAAKANELCLYALLLIQPLTGMAQSLTRGKPFPLLGLAVPKLMARSKDLTALFHSVHEVSAWTLLGLIGLHAGAALFHRFVLRDGVLQSMWPARRRPAKSA